MGYLADRYLKLGNLVIEKVKFTAVIRISDRRIRLFSFTSPPNDVVRSSFLEDGTIALVRVPHRT
jgi:hypothetical protein